MRDPKVPYAAYQCLCPAGYANGICDYDAIAQFRAECDVTSSIASDTLGGNCDVDVDECASAPCLNGAACTDSSVDVAVSTHAYRCTCTDGFANGVFEYDFIAEFSTECDVRESSMSTELSGNCDNDVDECLSSPCQNGATCAQSTTNSSVPPGDYRCACTAGFASGEAGCTRAPVVSGRN